MIVDSRWTSKKSLELHVSLLVCKPLQPFEDWVELALSQPPGSKGFQSQRGKPLS